MSGIRNGSYRWRKKGVQGLCDQKWGFNPERLSFTHIGVRLVLLLATCTHVSVAFVGQAWGLWGWQHEITIHERFIHESIYEGIVLRR